MKEFSLAFFFDLIFIFAAAFLPIFTLLRFFLNSAAYPLALALVSAFTVTFLFFMLGRLKNNQTNISKARKSAMQAAFLNLCFYSQKDCLSYFEEVFRKANISAMYKEKGLSICPYFSGEKLSTSEVCLALKGKDLSKSLLLTSELSPQAAEFTLQNNIKTLFGEKLFAIIEKSGIYPKQIIFAQKKIKKRAINFDLSRKKAKQFLFFGIALLLFSFIVPYPLYYIIMGTLLIVVSVFLKFFKTKEPQCPPPI